MGGTDAQKLEAYRLSSCQGKMCHRTGDTAKAHAGAVGGGMRHYKCLFCAWWHCGHAHSRKPKRRVPAEPRWPVRNMDSATHRVKNWTLSRVQCWEDDGGALMPEGD